MIVTNITSRVRPGCMEQSAAYLRKFLEVIKEVTGADAQIAGKLGALGEVMVFVQSEDGSDLGEGAAKLWGSQAYREIMDEGAAIFDSEATQISMWKIID